MDAFFSVMQIYIFTVSVMQHKWIFFWLYIYSLNRKYTIGPQIFKPRWKNCYKILLFHNIAQSRYSCLVWTLAIHFHLESSLKSPSLFTECYCVYRHVTALYHVTLSLCTVYYGKELKYIIIFCYNLYQISLTGRYTCNDQDSLKLYLQWHFRIKKNWMNVTAITQLKVSFIQKVH